MSKKINSNALSPETLALLLTNASQRLVTQEQVLAIAEQGDLLSEDGTISLIQYTAYLAKESEGKSNE